MGTLQFVGLSCPYGLHPGVCGVGIKAVMLAWRLGVHACKAARWLVYHDCGVANGRAHPVCGYPGRCKREDRLLLLLAVSCLLTLDIVLLLYDAPLPGYPTLDQQTTDETSTNCEWDYILPPVTFYIEHFVSARRKVGKILSNWFYHWSGAIIVFMLPIFVSYWRT